MLSVHVIVVLFHLVNLLLARSVSILDIVTLQFVLVLQLSDLIVMRVVPISL